MTLSGCGGGEVASETTVQTAETTVVADTTETTVAPSTSSTTTSPAPTTTMASPTTTIVLSEEAQAAQSILDRWIAAWNEGDVQAVRDLFSPDFSYNDANGVDWVDGAIDRYVGFVDEFEVVRTTDAVEGESGQFTWVVEFWSDASTRYPAETLDLDVTFEGSTIHYIDEHWHRDD
jgi:hypothetical protein